MGKEVKRHGKENGKKENGKSRGWWKVKSGVDKSG